MNDDQWLIIKRQGPFIEEIFRERGKRGSRGKTQEAENGDNVRI